MPKHLVAFLGIGKGSWGHVARLIAEESFDAITLISNEWGRQNFTPKKPVNWLMVNTRASFELLKSELSEKLPSGELVVSLISGSGKEHIALLAALKERKQEYQLVVLTGEGTKYF
ncbi:MAG: hypothetical protein HY393_04055 [Candidatus Diapherotrites archaeon]|nr:hypothetical protein [Candidatus Diapherotrites archaeon]